MNLSVAKFSIPDASQKEEIFKLWNNEYPAQLAYSSQSELDEYLNKLNNPLHYFASIDNKIVGWAFAFERDAETWFAIMVDSQFQNLKVGTTLMQSLKNDFKELNGWVTDHEKYVKKNGNTYKSPLAFYLRNNFKLVSEVRLEIEILSAVKIKWMYVNEPQL